MTDNNKILLIAGVVALVASFVIFGNGISGKFILDDQLVIIGNPLIGHTVDLPAIFTSPYHFHQPRSGLYRPLPIAMFSIEWFMFNGSPSGFHVINILLHALISWLVFVVAWKISGKKLAAWLAMALFLLMPIHVEDVTSIVGMAELLALLWVLAGLWAVLERRYVLATGALLIGLFSKETAIALVPMWLFVMYFVQRMHTKQLLRVMPHIVLSGVVYGVLRYVALGKEFFLFNDATFVSNPIKDAPFWPGLWTSMKVLTMYLQKTFAPIWFSSDYSYNQIPLVTNLFGSWQALVGILIVIIAIAVLIKKRHSPVGFGILAFLASYFVISNWVFKIGTIMGERLMFMPSFGIAVLIGYLVGELIERVKWPHIVWYVLGAVVGLFFIVQIFSGNKIWLNERNLLGNAYRRVPASVVNQTNRAYLSLVDTKYTEANQQIEEVLKIAPEHVPALNLAGEISKKLGKLAQAEAYWKKIIELRSDYIKAYLSLGILYYENGYFKSGEYIITKAVEIYPRWNEVFILSLTKSALGKYDEAVTTVSSHFGLEPEERQLRFALGVAYLKKGDEVRGKYYLVPMRDPNTTEEIFLNKIRTGTSFYLGDL